MEFSQGDAGRKTRWLKRAMGSAMPVRWASIALVLILATLGVLPGASGYTTLWTRQFGTAQDQVGAQAVHVDQTGVYVAGTVFGSGNLPGQTGPGQGDAFVRKYDFDGREVWTRQFGSSDGDFAQAIVVGFNSEGLYVAGYTQGALPGQTNLGNVDAFVRKYDLDGNIIWTSQFGTPDLDFALGVAADDQRVYVAGYTYGTLPGQTSAGGADGFVQAFDLTGGVLWTTQFGTVGTEFANGAYIEHESTTPLTVVGSTSGTLLGQVSAGGTDAFALAFDVSDGTVGTIRQFGTSASDDALGVAINPTGNVVVVGRTEGAFPGQVNSGGADGFVSMFDGSLVPLWTRQFGSSGEDVATSVSFDPSYSVVSFIRQYRLYVAGLTLGTLPGQTSAGGFDAVVRKYDWDGNTVWTKQFGTPGDDFAYGIGPNYVVGYAGGTFDGQVEFSTPGSADAFVMKLAPRRALTIELTGEFDYLQGEAVRVKVTAVVKDMIDGSSASGANVTARVYGDNNNLLLTSPMTELPGTGIYQLRSSGTVGGTPVPKGVYSVRVQAFFGDGPVAQAVLEFHVDPPGGAASVDFLSAGVGLTLVIVLAGVVATLLIRALRHRRTGRMNRQSR